MTDREPSDTDTSGRERRRVTEQWPDIQITRAIASLENSQTDLRNEVKALRGDIAELPDKLDEKFVRRETFEEIRRASDERHEDLAKWTADIAASLERVWRAKVDRKTVWSVLGVAVAVIAAASSIVAVIVHG